MVIIALQREDMSSLMEIMMTKNVFWAVFLAFFGLALGFASPAAADEEHPGLSLIGELKYGPGFPHFDYVNPDAPKGGTLRYAARGGFDSLNGYIIKGRPARFLNSIYDTLMTGNLDEPSTQYGLLAESVSYPPDYSSVTFTLRSEARFHDGQPVTPEDVIWTFEAIKSHHPFFKSYYANVVGAEKLSARQVRFRFSETGNRELPFIVGQLPVLPKHYWEGKDANGNPRDFSKTTLEPPLGSGPYRIGDFETNRRITYERVADYWGKDLNVNLGANNFDRLVFEYFQDNDVALEALKGGRVDVRLENSALNWATRYDAPAVAAGDLKREELATRQPQGMQAFVFNVRRPKFQDPRVREAFNWAFDYEWMNKAVFFGQYTRTDSYFENSELASSGLPEGRELEILDAYRGQVPDELFTEVYKNPVTDGNPKSGKARANLLRAKTLLEDAGWIIVDGVLTHGETGDVLSVEFLLQSGGSFERSAAPFVQSLKRLGIQAKLVLVDSAQYQKRQDTYDYDIIVGSFRQSLSPGNEQRDFWSSQVADKEGGRNLIGVKNPVVDALVEQIIFADDRADLVAATRALDRVLLWQHYVVPQWHLASERVAFWRRIAHPDPTPPYSIGFPDIWWYDADAAKALGDTVDGP